MPTYDYQCRSCGTITEVIHSMLEDGPSVCERCGGDLRRVLYPAGIIFKGPGFYSTDSRNGSSKTVTGTSSSSTGSGAGGSSDSKASSPSTGGESSSSAPSSSSTGDTA